MSYVDPAPTGVASQHLPQTKWAGYVQTCPRMPRLLQLHPNTPGMSRPPQITTDHLQITYRSPTAVQELLKHLEMLKLEIPEILMPTRSLSTEGWGCHHGSHLPLNMWCMYVTSPPIRLHQIHPVLLPSSGSGGQSKWYTSGAEKLQVEPDQSWETQNHEETRLNQNKLDQLGGINLPKIWTKFSSPIRHIGQSWLLDWTPESTPIPLLTT